MAHLLSALEVYISVICSIMREVGCIPPVFSLADDVLIRVCVRDVPCMCCCLVFSMFSGFGRHILFGMRPVCFLYVGLVLHVRCCTLTCVF